MTQTQLNWMQDNGYDPEQYDMDLNGNVLKRQAAVAEEPEREVMSMPRAFGTSFLGNLVPSAAALAGGAAGAELGALGGPFAPATIPLGAIIGGLGAGYLTGKGQQAALERFAPSAVEEMQRAETDQPVASWAGGSAPALLTFKPSFKGIEGLSAPLMRGRDTFTRFDPATISRFTPAALNVGVNAANAGAGQLVNMSEGGDFSLPRFAADTAFGSIVSNPNALGRRMGFPSLTPQRGPVNRLDLAGENARRASEAFETEYAGKPTEFGAKPTEQPIDPRRVSVAENRKAIEEVLAKMKAAPPEEFLQDLANDPFIGNLRDDPQAFQDFIGQRAEKYLEKSWKTSMDDINRISKNLEEGFGKEEVAEFDRAQARREEAKNLGIKDIQPARDAAEEIRQRFQRPVEEGPARITQEDLDVAAEIAARRGLKITFADLEGNRGRFQIETADGIPLIEIDPSAATRDTAIHEIGHDVYERSVGEGMRKGLVATAEDSPVYKAEYEARINARDKEGNPTHTETQARDIALEEGLIQAFGKAYPNVKTGAIRQWFNAIKASMKDLVGMKLSPEDASAYLYYLTNENVPWKGVAAVKTGDVGGEERMQRAQQETPEFKNWFGESKVVDADGKPLVMYHGTQKTGFDIFHEGSHFGTKEQVDALLYDKGRVRKQLLSRPGESGEFYRRNIESGQSREFGVDDSIYPVYLSIKNPKRVIDAGDTTGWMQEIKLAKAEGHDGLVYANNVEAVGDSYVAFNPEQVKSATANKGTFDPLNKDIRYQRPIVDQEISSAETSRPQRPAVFNSDTFIPRGTNIDIGAGKFDIGKQYLENERGVTESVPFDPFNRSVESNQAAVERLQSGERFGTATSTNVLNVIAETSIRDNVILQAARAIEPEGVAYFQIHEGDRSGIGGKTPFGFQNNKKTADYVEEIRQHFTDVRKTGNVIVASNPKISERKAFWQLSPDSEGPSVRYQRPTVGQAKEAVKAGLDKTLSEIDQITRRGGVYETVGRAMTRAYNTADAMLGKARSLGLTITKLNYADANKLRSHLYNEYKNQQLLTPAPEIAEAYKEWRTQAKPFWVDEANKAGFKIDAGKKGQRNRIESEFWFPGHDLSDEVRDILASKVGTPEYQKLKSDYLREAEADYLSQGKLLTEAQEKALVDFEEQRALNNKTFDPSAPATFAGARKPMGRPLPESWVEKDFRKTFESYNKRSAKDYAAQQHFEKSPEVMAALGSKKFFNDQPIPASVLQNTPVIAPDPSIQSVMREFSGQPLQMPGKTLRSWGAAASALALQTISRIGDVGGTVTKPLAYIGLGDYGAYMGGMAEKFSDWSKLKARSIESGLNNPNANQDFHQVIGMGQDAGKYMQKVLDGLGFITGSSKLESVARTLAQAQGEMIVSINKRKAATGDKDAVRFLDTLNNDWRTQSDMALAAQFGQMMQGTYDMRQLPAWFLEGGAAPYLTWSKWSMSQMNNFRKFAVEPAMQGNLKPLIAQVLVGMAGGGAIEQVQEWLSGKESKSVKWSELESWARQNEGTIGTDGGELLLQKFMIMAQKTGTFGFAGDLAMMPINALVGDTQSSVGVFPAAELAADLAKNVAGALTAIDKGEDVGLVLQRFGKNVIVGKTQMARVASTWVDEVFNEGSENLRSSDRRKARLFEELSGTGRSNGMFPVSYENLAEQKFERGSVSEKTGEEAFSLVERARKEATSGEDYASRIRKLKTSQNAIMPSLERQPMKAARYLSFVEGAEPGKGGETLKRYYTRQNEDKYRKSLIEGMSGIR